jgi:FMN reductase (NADPH)
MEKAQATTPTLHVIQAHGSVRHYRPDPLPRSLIETIVAAGQRASTSSNMQAYSVIAVTDADRRDQLARLCGNQEHVRRAPLFLAWCADLARLDRVCALRGYTQVAEYTENFLIAAVDAVVAAQNAAVAAESLGLGICYIGSIRNNPRQVIELLGLPRLVFPVTGLTVGWPERQALPRPRLPLSAMLHWEQYNPDQDEALHEYDRQMAASGIYDQRQAPVPGRPEQVEQYGWLEHSARRVSQPARTFLRSVLEEQGFTLR